MTLFYNCSHSPHVDLSIYRLFPNNYSASYRIRLAFTKLVLLLICYFKVFKIVYLFRYSWLLMRLWHFEFLFNCLFTMSTNYSSSLVIILNQFDWSPVHLPVSSLHLTPMCLRHTHYLIFTAFSLFLLTSCCSQSHWDSSEMIASDYFNIHHCISCHYIYTSTPFRNVSCLPATYLIIIVPYEWPFIPIHICELQGTGLPWSEMLITRYTRVTPWMYAYVWRQLR